MWCFEWREEEIKAAELLDRLNELGREGWDLRFREPAPGYLDRWRCTFKRTLTERDQLQAAFQVDAAVEPPIALRAGRAFGR